MRLQRRRLVADVDEVAVGVAQPEPPFGRATGRIDLGDARRADGLARLREGAPGRAEAEMVKPLPRTFVEEDVVARLPRRAQVHRVAAAGGVGQPEVTVVALADRLIRHLEGVVEQ